MYNPFVPFSELVLNSLRETGFQYVIVQRFYWPGIARNTAFLVSPYDSLKPAQEHEAQLEPKEGKLLDLASEPEKISDLIAPDSTYHLFLNKFKETNWDKRMLKEYQGSIINYLRSRTAFTRKDAIDINFVLEHGRLNAEIRAKDKSLDIPAFELINN